MLETIETRHTSQWSINGFSLTSLLNQVNNKSRLRTQRILHGRAKIRNFSSSVERYFMSERNERVKYIFNARREISYLQSAMLCSIYHINTNEIPNHFTLIVFWCKRRDLLCSHSNGDIFTCEDNMLFSLVKISSFRTKAHLVFHWCLYNKLYYHYMRIILSTRAVIVMFPSLRASFPGVPRRTGVGEG